MKFRCTARPRSVWNYHTNDGTVYYASLAGSYVGQINPQTGEATFLSLPFRPGSSACWEIRWGDLGREWDAGQVAGMIPRMIMARMEIPGTARGYAVYVDVTTWFG